MRRFSLLAALLGALALTSGAPAATIFVIKGQGWGHGVGLSQWGSFGLARGYRVDHPYTWQEIIAHYFHNTTIGNRGGNVSVFLAGGRQSVTIGPGFNVAAGSRSVDRSGDATVSSTSRGRIKVSGTTGSFASPATFSPTGSPLHLNGRHYRGNLVVSVSAGALRIVNRLGIDAYVRGVVTNESPASWGDQGAQEALNAQAVAARSYALYTVAHGGGKCGGALCPSTADQVYNGFDSETANGRKAVTATARKVVLHGGAVAQTFFSSSSGGRTAASGDTFVTSLPYLESTADPADLNPSNPNRFWRLLLTPRGLAKRLGTRRPGDAVVSSRVSGRVNSITVSRASWNQTVTGGPEHFRAIMRVKSSRFWIGVQSLRSDLARSRCRMPVHLAVFGHGVGTIKLEERKVTSSTWTEVPLNQVDATHSQVTRRPCVSMDYRIRSSDTARPRIHVDVSPNIAFDAQQQAGALTGKVNPLLPGVAVAVQRKTAAGWTRVATAVILGDGTFKATFAVQEATYRAKVVPPTSTGLVTGFSPSLNVQFH